MNWVREYLEAIRSGYEVVGRKIRTVYERECSWMENPPENFPYYFDENMANGILNLLKPFASIQKVNMRAGPCCWNYFRKLKYSWCLAGEKKRRTLEE